MRQVAPVTQESNKARTAVIIPTYNAAPWWERLYAGICRQSLQADRIILIDSSSQDGTEELARMARFDVLRIAQRDFNHGRTRQLAMEYAGKAEIVVYITQDAILATDSVVRNLLATFADPQVGLAYGRQLARPEARDIETYARFSTAHL
jgi:rhamnosyltransferase